MGDRDDAASFAIARLGDAVVLSGEIDLAAREALHQCLDRVEAPHGRLVVDLTEVSFIDSSGIEALCSARRRVAREGGTVVLRGPSAIVLRALEVTGVAPLFEIVPGVAPTPGAREP
jgi:anti-anti-sigma factor